MRALLLRLTAVLSSGALTIALAAQAGDLPQYQFFSEYVRHLIAIHDLQAKATKELAESVSLTDKNMTAIRSSTRIKLELGQSIGMMKGLKLADPFEDLPAHMTTLYRQEIDMHDALIELASQFVAGPKPGVDYGQLAATMPKISAELEFIDETLFKATPMFCFLLIDDKRLDSAGHTNRLLITAAQRKDLLERISSGFGKDLDAKNPIYVVASASVLRTCLRKDFKSADAP